MSPGGHRDAKRLRLLELDTLVRDGRSFPHAESSVPLKTEDGREEDGSTSVRPACIYAYCGVTSGQPRTVAVAEEIEDSLDHNRFHGFLSTRALLPAFVGCLSAEAKYVRAAKTFTLKPHERRGWWKDHPGDPTPHAPVMVSGAVFDHKCRIMLDTGANVSVMSESLARRLKLKIDTDRRLEFLGFGEQNVMAKGVTGIKVTLGSAIVYFMDVWVTQGEMPVPLLLGTDFMKSAGVRLDLWQGKCQLPDEVSIPILQATNGEPTATVAGRIPVRLPQVMHILAREYKCASVPCRPSEEAELWVTRGPMATHGPAVQARAVDQHPHHQHQRPTADLGAAPNGV